MWSDTLKVWFTCIYGRKIEGGGYKKERKVKIEKRVKNTRREKICPGSIAQHDNRESNIFLAAP